MTFQLPPLRSGTLYRMNLAVISMDVKLTKEDGTKLADDSKTAIENDAINTLFSKSSVVLNGVSVSSSDEHHYLKSAFNM